MKKILGILLIAIGLFVSSCEDPTPPPPACEVEGYGWATVVNKTGYQAVVDVTYTSTGVNYEKWLYNNGSYKYEMDEGRIYIWISFDQDDWVYDTYFLDACEDLEYTWYLNKKKSTNGGLYAVVRKEGVVVDTLNVFESLNK